jgi:hypothetical protein
MTTKPVTQTAEVEVKRASTNRRDPWGAAKGNQRRKPPARITPAKLRTKILAGERCLDKKVLILIRIFIGNEAWTTDVRMDFTQKRLSCQSEKDSYVEKIKQEIAGCHDHPHGWISRELGESE